MKASESRAGEGRKSAGAGSSKNRRESHDSVRMRELDTGMIKDEAAVIISFLAAVLFLLSNMGVCGPVGEWLKSLQTGLFGLLGYVFPIWMFISIVLIISNDASRRALITVFSSFISMLALGALIHLFAGNSFDEISSLGELYSLGVGGGLLGGILGGGLETVIGFAGAFVVCVSILIVSLVAVTGKSFVGAVRKGGGEAYEHARTGARQLHEEHLIKNEERRRQRELAKLVNIDLKAQESDSGQEILRAQNETEAQSELAGLPAQDAADEHDIHDVHGSDIQDEMPINEIMPRDDLNEAAVQYNSEDSGLDMRLKTLSDDALARETQSLAASVASITMKDHDIFSTPLAMDEDEFSLGYDSVKTYDYTAGDGYPDDRTASDDSGLTDEDDFSAYRQMLESEDMISNPDSSADDDSVPFDMFTVMPREGLDDTGIYARAESYTNAAQEAADEGGVYDAEQNTENHGCGNSTGWTAYADDSIVDAALPWSESDPVIGEHFADVKPHQIEYQDDYNSEDTQRTLSTQDMQSVQNLQSAHDTQSVQNLQSAHDTQSVQNLQSAHDTQSVQNLQSAHDMQDAQNLQSTQNPQSVQGKQNTQNVQSTSGNAQIKEKKVYVIPPTSLLSKGTGMMRSSSEREFGDTARKLEETLAQFGVKVTVTDVSCGPTVTRYELRPEMGVKVSKIVSLTDDIKLALAAADIRVEAPIPGKAAIGIEVPNKDNMTVHLRDLIESDVFKRSKARLLFAVGMDIAGSTVVGDIDKMPHMMIAGATGSGKSVCINTMVLSLLYRYSPEEVKLIMIDPKVVELSVYNGIPHLLIPVVTDPKKAASALNWAVEEMMKRYKMFEREGVRDISGYNQHIERLLSDGKRVDESTNMPYEKMPQIVIIIDELADLMMVSKNEVEDAICRIAQLARAAGIHLVIATQRPSVNVITGVIKANIPSRIAFAVSSGVDSRTILDSVGAEKLLGKGDMLYYPQGMAKPVRIQGAFVSDDEIRRVVDFIIQQDLAEYDADTIGKIEAGAGASSSDATQNQTQKEQDERDALFGEAGRYIIEAQKASIGNLQRKFRIGFNRAARIMDQLCECGVVGREQGTKPRDILMTMEEFEDYLSLS